MAARGGRVDAVIAEAWPDVSRARAQQLIAGGRVTVDGRRVKKSSPVRQGARISVTFPVHEQVPGPVPSGVALLFEDEHLVAVAKPAATVVHDSPGSPAPSIASWFVAHYPDDASRFPSERPGIVHRLDKDTTGVLLLARTPEAQEYLSRAFEQRRAEKTYVALVKGSPRLSRGLIEAAIGRDPRDRTRMAIVASGREARTRYEVVGESDGQALVEVHPETGRTHQIRVHLAALGCPVVGDAAYGGGVRGERQRLHAWRIRIPHPAGGELEVTAPLPADFQAQAIARGLGAEVVRYCESPPARRILK